MNEDTDPFAKWFGRSQVVEATGEPLTVYHATDAYFTRFSKTTDIGYHFGTLEQAQRRASVKGCHRILAVYLSLQNVVEMPDLGDWQPWRFCEDGMRDAYIVGASGVLYPAFTSREIAFVSAEIDRLYEEQPNRVDEWRYEPVLTLFREKGYDGITYRNVGETDGHEAGDYSYIALHAGQIKAVENSGAFDPDSNDIFDGAQHPSPVAGE